MGNSLIQLDCDVNAIKLCAIGKGRETVFTCLYPYTVQTRPLAGTASGMASDSVRGRGNICGADLEIKSKRGDGTLLIFEASA